MTIETHGVQFITHSRESENPSSVVLPIREFSGTTINPPTTHPFDRYFSPRAMFEFLRCLTHPRAFSQLLSNVFERNDEPSASNRVIGLTATGMGLGAMAMAAAESQRDITEMRQQVEMERSSEALEELNLAARETNPTRAVAALSALASIARNPQLSAWHHSISEKAVGFLLDYLKHHRHEIPPGGREVFWGLRIRDLNWLGAGGDLFEAIRLLLESNNQQLHTILREMDFHTLPGFDNFIKISTNYGTQGVILDIARRLGRRDLEEEARQILQRQEVSQQLRDNIDWDRVSSSRENFDILRERWAREIVTEWSYLDIPQRETWLLEAARRAYTVSDQEVPITFIANFFALHGIEFSPLTLPIQATGPTESLEEFIRRDYPEFPALGQEVREDILRRVRALWDPALVSDIDREALLAQWLQRGIEVQFIGEEGIPEPLLRDVVDSTCRRISPSGRRAQERRDREVEAAGRRGRIR